MIKTKAAVVEGPGAPFTVEEVELADLRPDEVLVRIVAAGLCHTDLGVQAGGIPFALPGVLGHEGAGVVVETGAAVTRVAPGDQVLLSFTSCGTCRSCRGGHPAYCDTWVPQNLIIGRRSDGEPTITRAGEPIGGRFFGQSSFAGHAIADERSLVKVPADAPLDVLAPLGCGVQTGFGTVWNVLAPEPGSTLAVFGAGAVGLAAVMAAAGLPLGAVVAVDRVTERLELARELGATHTIDTRAEDAAAVIAEATQGRGLDYAIDTTAVPAVVRTAVDALGVRGTCAIVGAPPAGTEVSFEVQSLLPGKRIVGVTLGDGEPETLIPQLVELHRAGRLPLEKLVRHYSLSELDAAAKDMHSGQTVKPVIRMDV
ncbi:NAD(P)-dependent alcohol dehydrogenase [Actinoplanes subtropicus]|uniref:NAD(P)-dependent alcohol dehydrogenase n=1 Tax=Actinoplanes subtropicus TaxID=543632 RepID=UPI0004C40927|nr:NAD(P)-dependent alcohol dehydrogenase [Actinoplanes subtropicus]